MLYPIYINLSLKILTNLFSLDLVFLQNFLNAISISFVSFISSSLNVLANFSMVAMHTEILQQSD